MGAKKKKLARKPAKKSRKVNARNHLRSVGASLGTAAAAKRAGVSQRTVQRWISCGVPIERREAIRAIVVTPRELQQHDAFEALAEARKKRRMPFSPITKPEAIETNRYTGTTVAARIPLTEAAVTEANIEAIKHRILNQAKKLSKRAGRFIVRIHTVNVGKAHGYPTGPVDPMRGIKSTYGPVSLSTESTQYAHATDAEGYVRIRTDYRTGRLKGPKSVSGLESLVDTMLSRIADEPAGASVVDSFTVVKYTKKKKQKPVKK